uniref:Uncharacterized protein n=1 Tax=Rhizophora mucronata TaxID=61149 RepID=A0A2P2J1D0_RHIMU
MAILYSICKIMGLKFGFCMCRSEH